MCMKGQWAAYKEVGHAQTLMMQRVAANKATWEQVDAGLCTKWAGVGFHALPLVYSKDNCQPENFDGVL